MVELTANGQTVNFFDHDHSMHDNLMIAFSGGTDSSLLLYLACTYMPEKKIVCQTGTDLAKDPFVGEYAKDIMIWMKKQFPNVNIIHELYTFNSMSLENIEIARKQIEEYEKLGTRWKYPSVYGHAKRVAQDPFKHKIRLKHNITMSTHGITMNPPVDVQKKIGFTHLAEPRRNHKYDVLEPKGEKYLHVKPFVNIDKRWVAGMYEKLGLMDELFPLTASCIGDNDDSRYYTEPCGDCFWCHEKLWAFGCYDGGLKPKDLSPKKPKKITNVANMDPDAQHAIK